MKNLQKALALLIALIFAFSFGIPAAAAEDPDVFRIIKQPQSQTIPTYAEGFSLSVAVYVPEGWTVEYQWYANNAPISGATEPVLRLSSFDSEFPSSSGKSYSCHMTVRDENGELFTGAAIVSDAAVVKTQINGIFYAILAAFFLWPFLWPLELIDMIIIGIARLFS